MHATLEPLEWENHFFGVNSSIVRWDDSAPVLTERRLALWERVQAKIAARRTDLLDDLQRLGFQLVEGEVDLVLEVGTQHVPPQITVAQESDIADLRAAAAQAFGQSRFRAPWYQEGDSGRFYARWVENAVLGTFDNQCLLLQESGLTRGFVTLRQLNQHEARIGLLAGRGAGAELMAAARFWCQQRDLTTLRVATQVSNTAALRCYIHSGATIESTAFWLYR